MNIFEHRDSFFGRPDAEITDGSLMSAFHLAKQIRLRLGKQGYLLDGYISLFLEGVTSTLAFDAADDGYLTGGEFQTLLFSLIDGTDAKKDHPLYPRMREAYEERSGELCFQERYPQNEGDAFTVPTGCAFLLGDHRANYQDSRFWKEPFIPVSKIRARALVDFSLWPGNTWTGVRKVS